MPTSITPSAPGGAERPWLGDATSRRQYPTEAPCTHRGLTTAGQAVGIDFPSAVRSSSVGRPMRPRIFLGSSGQQEKLLQALTRGLQDLADVDPWTIVFNPGVSTL